MHASALWNNPPDPLMLESNEVHVWRANLNVSEQRLQQLRDILASDEQARAGRFHFEKDRRHFTAARGILRMILGRYLRLEPARLQFCYNAFGKPALIEKQAGRSVRFNLSHSDGLALIAVSRDREVGIDVERIRPELADLQIAQRFFSPWEVSELIRIQPHLRQKAFFNCWTRKEAYIKAKGKGLSLPLNQFDVSLTPGEPAALLRNHLDSGEVSRWSLHELIPGPDTVAALAVEGSSWILKCWRWPDG